MSIAKLWIFADRREIPLLMNEMVDFLHQKMVAAWYLPNSTLTESYDNTTEENCLRRMVVDMYATLTGSTQAASMLNKSNCYPQHFLIDPVQGLIERASRMLTKKEYRKADMCPSFHVHEEGVSCTKKGKKRSSGEMEEEE